MHTADDFVLLVTTRSKSAKTGTSYAAERQRKSVDTTAQLVPPSDVEVERADNLPDCPTASQSERPTEQSDVIPSPVVSDLRPTEVHSSTAEATEPAELEVNAEVAVDVRSDVDPLAANDNESFRVISASDYEDDE